MLHRALDGRSFDRLVQPVLTAAEPWENGTVGAPSVLQVGDEVWLYYAGGGGIGMAKSQDGVSFTRAGAGPPVKTLAQPVAVHTNYCASGKYDHPI